ncbi:MAG: hypothetical protein A2365_01720 [Candidatus Nealsonbacteria bacterium RIFOXYB1_FULL_40_15]|uniref:N-acetyltransferase domain-containing protein n=2 Tax=Candidatus Nealsoniibacteriota TaxID=1817911 RepID=A0A1G2ELV6_9BACT|nr:MAG: hypothetical protein A2427_00550 [Candidatus Nealsonbacteria bacterium RIFOXYC1_FULL_40_7]OGZ27564.1 MAG: hypothetical protein A2365_01720 [Candidatus Nealsonbacteria bacterium RIFOXYB1_FULL_40_15]OGZ28287.1 MAG: hypothetical protein A2562_04420 [Candidatus Nealsonbacteria bacterium RIFOXYD1_FULL_39_11]
MKIKIRIAKPEDAGKIVAINKIGWLTTYVNQENGITKADILSKNFNRQKAWRESIQNHKRESHFWIAECDGKIIGYISAKKDKEYNELGIYILPKFQSMGIGGRLIKKAFKWLGEEKKIRISVVGYNAKAINFYSKHGFIKIKNENHKLPSGKNLPTIMMIK